MTETIATYSVEPSDDRDFTLEEIQAIADTAKTSEPKLTELEQLNLKVAAIAGWENIQEWNPSHKPKKVFQGTNKKHPELGIFVPDYTRDLNAIFAVFMQFDLLPELLSQSAFKPPRHSDQVEWVAIHNSFTGGWIKGRDPNPAIALCKLLLELAPNLPKPEPEKTLNAYDLNVIGDYVSTLKYKSEVQVIDDDGEIDEPTVIEATFA